MDDDEEIYEDALSVKENPRASVNNLKSKFENKPVMFPKPVPAAKPVPMAKPNGTQTQKGMISENRRSKVNIPDLFKTDANKTDGTSAPISPKPIAHMISKIESESTVKTTGEESKVNSSEKPKSKEPTIEKVVPVTSNTSSVHALQATLDLKSLLKPVPQQSDKPIQIEFRSKLKNHGDKDDAVPIVLRKPSQHNQQKKQQSRKSFLRHDGKKFLLVEEFALNSKVDIIAPAKPESLTIDLDMESLKMDFETEKSSQERSNSGRVEEVEDETYDDIANVVREQRSVVSYIHELTEEEETNWHKENGFPPPPQEIQNDVGPDETYDDASSKIADTAKEDEESQEMYEMLPEEPAIKQASSDSSGDSITPTYQSEKLVADEDMMSLKKKEKDKKSKDKDKDKEKAKEKDKTKDKEQEKKRKKIEANNNKILKELKMKPDDLLKAIGKGKVKENNPGGKNNSLAVTKGLLITIIRMDLKDKKYKGKWLIQTEDNEVGFVDSQNIEVQTGLIRSLVIGFLLQPEYFVVEEPQTHGKTLMMQGKVSEPSVNQIDGENYEDVPNAEEGGEEIYELLED